MNDEEGQTSSISSEDMRINNPFKKELPTFWPQIASAEEEQAVYQLLRDPDEDLSKPPKNAHIHRLSYQLMEGQKRLRFFATWHSPSPDDVNYKQYDLIEKAFFSSPPQVVFYEGGPSGGQFLSREQAIQRGEPGFVQYLVQRYNESHPESPIIIESGDIPTSALVQEYKRLGHTNEEISSQELFSHMEYVARIVTHDPTLSEDQKQSKLKEISQLIKTNYPQFAQTYHLPTINNPHLVEDFIKVTGQDINLSLQRSQVPLFQKMFEENRIFRDQYIMKKGADKFKNYDRVDYIFGSGHAIREKKAWEQYFNSTAQSLSVETPALNRV